MCCINPTAKQFPLGMRNEGKHGQGLCDQIWQLNYASSHMVGYNLGLTAAETVNDWPAFRTEGARPHVHDLSTRAENRAFWNTTNWTIDEIPRHFTKLNLLKRHLQEMLNEHILANWENWKQIRGLISWITTLLIVCIPCMSLILCFGVNDYSVRPWLWTWTCTM